MGALMVFFMSRCLVILELCILILLLLLLLPHGSYLDRHEHLLQYNEACCLPALVPQPQNPGCTECQEMAAWFEHTFNI